MTTILPLKVQTDDDIRNVAEKIHFNAARLLGPRWFGRRVVDSVLRADV